MVVFRREESFRYTFNQEIHGILTVTSRDGIHQDAEQAYVTLLDLSPNGMKIKSQLDLSIPKTKYDFVITFVLNNKELSVIGVPIWKKQMGPHTFFYGVKGFNNEQKKREIIEELKLYVHH